MDYRVDELARAAGMTVRNLRAYQDRGLLPPPRLAGRVGLYSEAHLARLRLIGHLLEQGQSLNMIAKLIESWQSGRDLADVLGVEEALIGSWSDEQASSVGVEDLAALFGPDAATALPRAVAAGILVPEEGKFRVPSPRLLHAGAELVRAGLPLGTVLELMDSLAADMAVVARRLVDAVGDHVLGEPPELLGGAEDGLRDLSALIRRLRPLAGMAVQAQLARAMQAAVEERFGEQFAAAAAARRPAAAS
ncbi:MAG TPA: MerR family transcriptional regulator [Mycobacteriales bacterium]|nr:MerR family transcriptional regulator [Mycobacteriales bacterium]